MSFLGLLDTDVCIDVLRKHPPSIDWLTNVDVTTIGIPIFVVLELIQNSSNRREADACGLFYNQFEIVLPSTQGLIALPHQFVDLHLAQGTGLIDVLIAGTAISHQVPLYTFNIRHYKNIPDLHITQPYTR
ncbi:MAG TPA: PIN domain-containing protein [Capsulimonadaceae bacterium]|jgi:hypothetical protein